MSLKPHAVCVPWPEQGHIKPMMTLAKLLHLRGFHITFVHSQPNYDKIVSTVGSDSLRGVDRFRFATITEAPFDDLTGCRLRYLASFRDLVAKLTGAADGEQPPPPPVSVIISDLLTTFSHIVADELGVPKLIYTFSACSLMMCIQIERLLQTGLIPLKTEDDLTNGYLDTVVEGIPGMSNIRIRDFPTYTRTTKADDYSVLYIIEEVKASFHSSAIILETFDELESPVIDALSKMLPPLYTVAPLQLLYRQYPNRKLDSLVTSLWIEDDRSLDWLKGRKPGSVLYVNFGSTTILTNEQLTELAWGLANSGCDFLWVIRENLVNGEMATLLEDFKAETKERGMLANWCKQEEVLAHPAIGGFLTHCGWNSMLESIMSGVPMICMPYFVDHHFQCRYACTVWGIGMEIGDVVKKESVAALVRELMEGEKGKEVKSKAIEWKNSVDKAVRPGGSSFENLSRVFEEVLLCDEMKTV